MAQWKEVRKLGEEKQNIIFGLWREPYSLEVRDYLGHWLEEYILNCNLDWENENHHPFIVERMGELSQALAAKAIEISKHDVTAYITVTRLQHAAYTIWNATQKYRIDLFGEIKKHLKTEKELIEQQQTDNTSNLQGERSSSVIEVMEVSTNELNLKLGQNSHVVEDITNAYEHLAIQVHNDQLLQNRIEQGVENFTLIDNLPDINVQQMFAHQKLQVEGAILQWISTITEKKKIFVSHQIQLLDSIQAFEAIILEEISKWNRQFHFNVQTVPLEILQKWALSLAQALLQIRKQFRDGENVLQQCQALSSPSMGNNFIPPTLTQIPNPEAEIKKLMAELIQNCLTVETQPDTVIKENKSFKATLRFLIGSLPEFSKNQQEVDMSVCVLNEAGAKEFISKNGKSKPKTSGEIINKLKNGKGKGTNNKGQLGVNGNIVHGEFKNLQVTKVNHKDQNKDSVTDERFWLLFQSEFTFDCLKFKIWTFSSPLRINSHGNQKEKSMSSLIWDNAAGDTGSIFPDSPRKQTLPIERASHAINALFISMTQRALTPHNIEAINVKMQSLPTERETPLGHITLKKFREEKLPDTEFTFWTWIYSAIKFLVKHLCGDENSNGPWQDGLIVGFTRSKKETEEQMTLNTIQGTFLLRFSDTTLGSISICMRDINKAWSVEPFNSAALDIKSLPARILGIAELWYLFPSTPKDQAFSKYMPKSDKATNGAPRKLSARQYVYSVLMDQILIPSTTPGSSTRQAELPSFLYQDQNSGSGENMDTELSPELEKILEDKVDNFFQRSVEASGSVSTNGTGEDGYNSVDSAELSTDEAEVSRC